MSKGHLQVEILSTMQKNQIGVQQYPQNQIWSPKP